MDGDFRFFGEQPIPHAYYLKEDVGYYVTLSVFSDIEWMEMYL